MENALSGTEFWKSVQEGFQKVLENKGYGYTVYEFLKMPK